MVAIFLKMFFTIWERQSFVEEGPKEIPLKFLTNFKKSTQDNITPV